MDVGRGDEEKPYKQLSVYQAHFRNSCFRREIEMRTVPDKEQRHCVLELENPVQSCAAH